MLVPARFLSRNAVLWCSSKLTGVRCFSHPPQAQGTGDDDKQSTIIDTKATSTPDSGIGKNVKRHLYLHNSPTSSGDTTKPLVLLFKWLYAKPAHVEKYLALYHNLGLDVLAVRGKLAHFMWPPDGSKLAQELFTYLKRSRPDHEKVLVHAVSTGVYNYMIAMDAARKNTAECGFFRDKVMGQIFESVVLGDVEKISRRQFQQILPNNKAFRQVVMHALDVYYYVDRKTNRETYKMLVSHLKEDPIAVPTLFFSAENDPICDISAMNAMLERWKSERPNFDITSVCWPSSVHAAHFREHPEEYLAAWRDHMEKLQLLQKADK